MSGRCPATPDALQQVAWNLLSNAVKFTPEERRASRCGVERVNSHVEVAVSDTGVGIGPEFLPFVFERFRQADASLSRKAGGLGLGLSIVRHIVEMHGGAVLASSDGEGRGATFRVRLPVMVVHASSVDDAKREHPTDGVGAAVDRARRLDRHSGHGRRRRGGCAGIAAGRAQKRPARR